MTAAYGLTHGQSLFIWSEGQLSLGALQHSSNEQCKLSQWLCHDDSTTDTVISTSDSFTIMALYKFTYLLTYLMGIIITYYITSLHSKPHCQVTPRHRQRMVMSWHAFFKPHSHINHVKYSIQVMIVHLCQNSSRPAECRISSHVLLVKWSWCLQPACLLVHLEMSYLPLNTTSDWTTTVPIINSCI